MAADNDVAEVLGVLASKLTIEPAAESGGVTFVYSDDEVVAAEVVLQAFVTDLFADVG